MKIIIVGAGIAGLSTYLFLRKHLADIPDLEIKIYEGYDISRYIARITDKSITHATSAAERSEAEITARSSLTEEGFNVEATGSAIGISKNGLDVLSRLLASSNGPDEVGFGSVLEDMVKQGHPITRWEMGSARGWKLADIQLVPEAEGEKQRAASKEGIESPVSVPFENSNKDRDLKDEENELLHNSNITAIMIGRQAFWSILLRYVVKLAGKDVIHHKRISEISIPAKCSSVPQIRFTDGSSEKADLVVGADGLRSTVRKSMFAPPQPHVDSEIGATPTSWLQKLISTLSILFKSAPQTSNDSITPHYEGLVGVGGFIPSSILETAGHKPDTMSIVFGPNGFFGCGYITSRPPSDTSPTPPDFSGAAAMSGPVGVYWSTFSSSNPYPYAPTATSATPRPYQFDRAAAQSALLSRHRNWKHPGVQAILSYISQNPHSQPEGFYPTYTTPELLHWSVKGRIVLVGDAAHALQPSSGQGASQALEDAEALALTLKHSLLKNTSATNPKDSSAGQGSALELAMRNYEAVRMPRVHAIYERSQKIGSMKADMGLVMEMLMYGMIKVMSFFHDGYNERLVNYDLPLEVERVVSEGG